MTGVVNPCREPLFDRRGRVPLLLEALDVLGQRQLLAVNLHGRVEGRSHLVRVH